MTDSIESIGAPAPNTEVSAGKLVAMLRIAVLRQRRIVVSIPLLAGVTAALLAITKDPVYTARSRFQPLRSEGAVPRFSGLAAQLGLNVIAGTSQQSLEFYAALIESRQLLRDVVEAEYTVPGRNETPEQKASLIEILQVAAPTPAARLNKAVRILQSMVSAEPQFTTGMISVETRARSPELALELNERLLRSVNDFNLKIRQSAASTERRFVGDRLEDARRELEQAEDALKWFLQRNRRYESSPELSFEHAQLERRVAFRQQLYTVLAQSHEQARIDEVRNVPVVLIIEEPRGSVQKVGIHPIVAALAASVAGLFVALAIVLVRAHQERIATSGHLPIGSVRSEAAHLPPAIAR